jgi:hypothetical protein
LIGRELPLTDGNPFQYAEVAGLAQPGPVTPFGS